MHALLWIAGTLLALAAVAFVLFLIFPYRMLWYIVNILRYTFYRVRVRGLENLPADGPAMLVANHVSPFDGLIIMGATKQQIHFLMGQQFFRRGFFRFFYRRLGVIEVPGPRQTKKMVAFFEQVRETLRNGGIICTYPEGGVSGNGLIGSFKKWSDEMFPEGVEVPVIPIRLGMVFGGVFSVRDGRIRASMPLQMPIPVDVSIGRPIPHDIDPFKLRQLVSEMGADIECDPFKGERTIHYAFAKRAKMHKFKRTFFDAETLEATSDFKILVGALLLSKEIRKLDPRNSEYIGVLMPNVSKSAAVLHAVLLADRVPAVLNYTSSPATFDAAVKKAALPFILTSKKFIEKLGWEKNDKMIFLEDVAKNITKKAQLKMLLAAALLPTRWLMKIYSPISARDRYREAVLLFSSGSTGIPKGVMLTHHNLNANIQNFLRTINWNRKKDKLVGNLPLFHAFGIVAGFSFPSVSGAPVVFIANPLDAAGVCKAVEFHQCTIMLATPTFLQTYMRKYKPGQFDSLRLVITGAEKLRQDIADKFEAMTGLAVTEGFGCTELSPIVAINLAHSLHDLGKVFGKAGSIGAALPGVHVKIVDPDTMEELPPNTAGLMLVKGGLVMKGYLDDPEATAKVMYHGYYITGDMASMSEDGYISITGRLSRFSKIGGEMVPHEMVEMAINEAINSENRSIAVTGKSDPKRGEKLVVFYSVPDLKPETVIEALRAKKLANLWIPKAADFHFIEKIPALGSGKLDLQMIKKLADDLPE